MSNPSLGRIACPTCSTDGADVRQTKRRGAHLYWQCAECGLMQPTGAAIQSRLWRETEWHADAEPKRPANVTSGEGHAATPTGTAKDTADEFDPSEADEPSEPQPTAERPSPVKGVGVLLLGALGLGVFLATQ